MPLINSAPILNATNDFFACIDQTAVVQCLGMISLSKIKKFIDKPSLDDVEKPHEIDTESEKVAKILPDELYRNVARIINLDEDVKEKISIKKKKSYRRLYKGVRHLSRALQAVTFDRDFSEEYYTDSSVEPPTPREKRKSIENPYRNFFQKTEREQIRWTTKYLPPETEFEKGLIRRADELTDKICSEFCTYMNDLGGYDSALFKQETVKKLFEIEFEAHIAHSLKTNPTEIRPIPKTNKWSKSISVPNKIATMENVWQNITALKSVQNFCEWIVEHPKAIRPTYLTPMFDKNKLNKMKHYHKYDACNKLPKIEGTKLPELKNRRISIPSIDIKLNSIGNNKAVV